MDKEAIREELNKVREEIKGIRSSFSKKKVEKEDFFQKGEEYSNQINSLYEEVKHIESENNLDKINEELDAKKVEYDEIKGKLKELEEAFEKVRSTSKASVKKPEIKTVSVEKAKKEVVKLELKLQTQVLSLDKESELIKKITEMKDMIAAQTGISSEGSDEFKSVRKELRSVKRRYIVLEKKIRSLYKQIRLISREKKQKYKQIDELRELKKNSFESFRLNKKDYSKLGKDLKDLFKKEDEILSSLGESPVQKKKSFDKNIKIKQKEVEEKLMKKGGTLTTEDLLAFQRR
ncbi:MAG: hypothetical protein KC550_01300 [Nanoarchaeota archaeon]|nr:hypothetical protein [Nanoarchaeota archaeon]